MPTQTLSRETAKSILTRKETMDFSGFDLREEKINDQYTAVYIYDKGLYFNNYHYLVDTVHKEIFIADNRLPEGVNIKLYERTLSK